MELDTLAIQKQAETEVAEKTSPPKYSALPTAFNVAVGTGVACLTFCLVLGLDWDNPKAMQGVYITAALAWAVTYFPLRSQEKRYSEAVSKRFFELVEKARSQEKH